MDKSPPIIKIMRNAIILFLFVILFPLCGFAFDFKDLTKYQGVAIKTLTLRDSMYGEHSNMRIMGTKGLDNLLGNKSSDYNTEYVYFSDNKIENSGKSNWKYFYPKSWKGRGKGELKYDKNDVMGYGRAGDTLVIARKPKDEILFLIVAAGSAAERELYEHLKLQKPKTESFLTSVFGKSKPEPIIAATEDLLPELPSIVISEKVFIQRYYTPGPDCENGIIAELNKAKKSVDIAVYGINNPRIVDAIINAHERGVRVRIITDRLEISKKNAKIAASRIKPLGIPMLVNKKHRIMHHKFAIYDKKTMSDGSYNWTDNASKTNAEDCTFSGFAPDRGERFNYLWELYNKE